MLKSNAKSVNRSLIPRSLRIEPVQAQKDDAEVGDTLAVGEEVGRDAVEVAVAASAFPGGSRLRQFLRRFAQRGRAFGENET